MRPWIDIQRGRPRTLRITGRTGPHGYENRQSVRTTVGVLDLGVHIRKVEGSSPPAPTC